MVRPSRRLPDAAAAKLRNCNNLLLLALVAFAITIVILAVALVLYKVSGTAQLDLSRPGYEAARDKSENIKSDEFSPTGALNDRAMAEFRSLFNTRAEKIESIDAFKADTLDDGAFSIAE